MPTKSSIRKTVEALAGLSIRGRLFALDNESVSVDAGRAHYDILLDYVTNAEELAKAKEGDAVEIHVLPNAKIIQKCVVQPRIPGIATTNRFRSFSGCFYVTDCPGECPWKCDTECSRTECSYCVCDCDTECSYCAGDCVPECLDCVDDCRYPDASTQMAGRYKRRFGRPFRRFVR